MFLSTTTESPLLSNHYGVPQGSTLGPLLFILYINNLPSSVNCTPRLFADDTYSLFSAPSLSNLHFDMKKDLNDISEWFTANELTINPSKLNVLVIPPKLSQPLPNVDLSINNSPLLFFLSAKYLGVILDTQLNFDKHISSVENNII